MITNNHPNTWPKRKIVALLEDSLAALRTAHSLIEDSIEGRKLNANRLENYYNDMHYVVVGLGQLGSLIDAALGYAVDNDFMDGDPDPSDDLESGS